MGPDWDRRGVSPIHAAPVRPDRNACDSACGGDKAHGRHATHAWRRHQQAAPRVVAPDSPDRAVMARGLPARRGPGTERRPDDDTGAGGARGALGRPHRLAHHELPTFGPTSELAALALLAAAAQGRQAAMRARLPRSGLVTDGGDIRAVAEPLGLGWSLLRRDMRSEVVAHRIRTSFGARTPRRARCR